MSISQNVTVYTGTFTKLDGSRRTMRFVKYEDVPASVRGASNRSMSSGFETVYDVDSNGFRTFNNATVIGEVSRSQQNVTFSR
jgi:hypothetical protein